MIDHEIISTVVMGGSRRGGGAVGPDPLKITKLPSQHLMFGHHWNASETPFKIEMAFRWRANDGPLIAVFGSYIPSSTKKKNVIKFAPPLTKLSGSTHGRR